MTSRAKGIVSLLSIGVLFGLSGVIAKYLSSYLSAYQVVAFRFLIAFLAILFISLLTKNKTSFNDIDKKSLLYFSVAFPLSVIFFTLAIFNTTVSLAVFSFYISTLVTSFIVGKLFLGESISTNKRISLFFILAAVVTLTEVYKGITINTGFMYGLISGLLQTIASYYQKTLGKNTNRTNLLIIQTFTGFTLAAAILIYLGTPVLIALPAVTLGITVLFGLIFLLISYLFLVGFKYTNLNVGSILVSSELLFGPLFAWLLLSEVITLPVILGGILTGTAVFCANRD